MSTVSNFSDEQKAVIEEILTGTQDVQVIAGAGAGKTKTIVQTVCDAVKASPSGVPARYSEKDILVLTFSRAGVDTLVDRLTKAHALNKPKDVVRTFDSVFRSVTGTDLKRFADRTEERKKHNLPLASTLLRQAIKSPTVQLRDWARKQYEDDDDSVGSDEVFKKIQSVIGRVLSAGHYLDSPESDVMINDVHVSQVVRAYNALLQQGGDVLFGINALQALDILRGKQADPTFFSYKLVIVDEAQDNNSVQQEAARIFSRFGRLVMVGDPRQCVNRWRGSAPKIFNDFTTAPTTTLKQMTMNYRSELEVVGLGNYVAGHMPSSSTTAAAMHATPARKANSPKAIRFMVSYSAVAEVAQRVWSAGKGAGTEVAVLARNWSHLKQIEQELFCRGVPVSIKEGQSKVGAYDIQLVRTLEQNWKASAHDTERELYVRSETARNQFFWNKANKYAQAEWNLCKLASSFVRWHAENGPGSGAAVAPPIPFMSFLSAVPIAARNTGRSVPLRPKPGVVLSTVHSTKGMEFGVVLLCEWGLTPYTKDKPSPEELAARVEDELRLYYVAVTRAEEALVLVCPDDADKEDFFGVKPSSFLKELKAHLGGDADRTVRR